MKHYEDEDGPEHGKLEVVELNEDVTAAKSSPGGSLFVRSEDHGAESDMFLVGFDKGDDIDPRRWSKWYLNYIIFLVVLSTFYAMTASTILTPFAQGMVTDLKLNSWMVDLAISHYEISFCVGPPVWGWLSEQYGRKRVMLFCVNGLALFQMGCALSPSATVITFFRIVVGLFASGLLPVSAAIIADICDHEVSDRGLSPFVTQLIIPPAGSSLGGFMTKTNLDWHGVIWVFALIAGAFVALIAVTLPETHRPTILVKHARQLRKEMHDDRYHAPRESSPKSRLGQSFAHPVAPFIREPVLLVLGLWLASIIACLNVFFEASTIASKAYTPPIAAFLANPALIVGNITASIFYGHVLWPRLYLRRYSVKDIAPERRLVFAVGATPFLAIAYFWFGWTLFPNVSVGAPLSASVLVGISSALLTLAVFIYIIDVYEDVAAMALGCCIATSSAFTAVLPVISGKMFRVLGLHWAATLAGCVTIATIPIPILLMRYGSTLRGKSRYGKQ